MSNHLVGLDIIGGDATADALALEQGKRMAAKPVSKGDGGMRWTEIAGIAAAVVIGVIAWPHIIAAD